MNTYMHIPLLLLRLFFFIPVDRKNNFFSLQAMEILQQSLPLELRPYRFLGWKTLDSAREITTLAFRGLKDVLVSGSIDCRVCYFIAGSIQFHVGKQYFFSLAGEHMGCPQPCRDKGDTRAQHSAVGGHVDTLLSHRIHHC